MFHHNLNNQAFVLEAQVKLSYVLTAIVVIIWLFKTLLQDATTVGILYNNQEVNLDH
jgi:flagellar biogenesis protein FliO